MKKMLLPAFALLLVSTLLSAQTYKFRTFTASRAAERAAAFPLCVDALLRKPQSARICDRFVAANYTVLFLLYSWIWIGARRRDSLKRA